MARERNMVEAGEIRQSATITTFSVGAMVDFVNGSFMTMGIDFWHPPTRGQTSIHEPHLVADLGAQLKPPPRKDPGGTPDGLIKCIRFPTWLVCNNRNCGRLGKIMLPIDNKEHHIFEVNNYNNMLGKANCTACNRGIGIPPRFVCICTDTKPDGTPCQHPHTGGHIQDFPWVEWCHQRQQSIQPGNHRLKLRETDGLSFESMLVECIDCNGNASKSLAGIFGEEFGRQFYCKGNIPWLDIWNAGCGCKLKVFQRGATSIHRPETVTYISIPPASDSISADTNRYFDGFNERYDEAKDFSAPAPVDKLALARRYYDSVMIPNNFQSHGHDKNRVIDILATFPDHFVPPVDAPAPNTNMVDRKNKEYQQLSSAVGTARDEFQTEVSLRPGQLHSAVDSVMFVRRLREVTALTGFSRDHGGTSAKARIYRQGGIQDNNGTPKWYPAIELRGEGIFLRLGEQRLNALVQHESVLDRCQRISTQLCNLEYPTDGQIRGPFRFQNPSTRPELYDPKNMARLLVTHTTCHLLMRELTLECGYSSSSLKERLYFDKDCFGFLIYASNPGADGTRGGLVRMGEESRLKPIFESALEKARWCSSDPICATCYSQGTDSLNLASCHACALLPETSCELRNQFLDRCIVVKSEAEGLPGFFD